MTDMTLGDLQESMRDRSAFKALDDYHKICHAFLALMQQEQPTRIVSPSHPNYIFFQYSQDYGHKITRPLNVNLFMESVANFDAAFARLIAFLADLRKYRETASYHHASNKQYVESKAINRVVYTIQQSIGCIGDSFDNANQSRRRVGQLFETLVKLIIQEVGMECESRTISVPIPNYPGYKMSYQLDLVFSRNTAIITSETKFIHPAEIVGSVKTTSKDRLDKVFLDKYLLTKLLGRDIPVVAIFLHDVQRARRGNSIFGINATFKSNHFLGYTVALNKLDGVYYVDTRPNMLADQRLHEYIGDFQRFLTQDLWVLTDK